MNYLLDTHIAIWAVLDPDKLTKLQKDVLLDPVVEKFISSISIWEISLKFSLGKLDLGGRTPVEFIASMYDLGVKHITPSPDQWASFYLLPKIDGHKDPFDRMIIWLAMQSGLSLLSSDKLIATYKLSGLRVI